MNLIPRLSAPISSDKISPPIEEHLQELPYGKMRWENFEKLIYRLALKVSEIKEARPYGVQGDGQEGIDLYAKNSSEEYIVYQCKREKDFTGAKIKAAVELFGKKQWAKTAKKFILCTHESLQNTNRDTEVRKQHAELKSKGIGMEVWDSVYLNKELKDNPQLVYDFFGMNWTTVFCGKEKIVSLKLSHPLPDRISYDPPEEYIPRTVIRSDKNDLWAIFYKNSTLFDAARQEKKIALLAWGLNGKSTELRQLAYEFYTKTDDYIF